MNKYWSQRAKRVKPYTAGEQPKEKNIIKLNTNENPYPPSPKVFDAIRNFDIEKLRLYPNATSEMLREEIAKYHDVKIENVFCGNGSDEVLALAFQAFFDEFVYMPEITYSFYPVWAEMYDIAVRKVRVDWDFSVEYEGFYGAENVVLANPNAPTSMALTPDILNRIAEHTKGVFVIDEAYAEFWCNSAIGLTKKHKNTLVVRTLSKSHSLAGLRVGYAIGDEGLIEALERMRDSFNSYPLDMIAQVAACEAIKDVNYTRENISRIIAAREYTSEALRACGCEVLPSSSNFLFCHPTRPAGDVYEILRKRNILVRHFSGDRVKDWLRITIGRIEEMQVLVNIMQVISGGSNDWR